MDVISGNALIAVTATWSPRLLPDNCLPPSVPASVTIREGVLNPSFCLKPILLGCFLWCLFVVRKVSNCFLGVDFLSDAPPYVFG